MKISSKNMLILLLILVSLAPLYGVLGIFAPFGIVTIPEFYVVAIYFDFLVYTIFSYSRVVFIELIPPGRESSFLSLHAITDKGKFVSNYSSVILANI